jgi:hypothetical protein
VTSSALGFGHTKIRGRVVKFIDSTLALERLVMEKAISVVGTWQANAA